MKATRVHGAIRVECFGTLPDGVRYLTTACADYDALRALPEVVNFCGNLYARTGWNSDRCIAYYRDDAYVGRRYARA